MANDGSSNETVHADIRRKLRLADTVTSDMVQGFEWDLQIALDNSKYANWLIGFASVGLGLCVHTLKAPAESFFLAANQSYFLSIAALAAFLLALLSGVWAKKNVLKAIRLKRVQMALITRQRGIVLAKERIDDDLAIMMIKIRQLLYIETDKRREAIRLDDEDAKLVSEQKLIYWQEATLGVAYCLLLLVSIPDP